MVAYTYKSMEIHLRKPEVIFSDANRCFVSVSIAMSLYALAIASYVAKLFGISA